ncbi:MAG: PAS domain-containing protein, partial [Gemmatimonadetes bacterium]|nr:PAS domain-containing protein [Gemmatimonadota bacterium]
MKAKFSLLELRAAAAGLREPLLLVDEEYRIRYLNPAAEQALGLAVRDADGRELPALLPGRYGRGEVSLGPGWRSERVSGGWAIYGELVE